MKTFVIGVVAVLVLLIGAILVLPAFIDWNRYKPQIVEAAHRLTGRTLSIEGAIHFRILPVPALSVDGVRLSNIAGGTAPDMARLDSLDIRVALGPLLTGEVQVESIRLIRPVILLEVTPNGRANWDFATNTGAAAGGADLGGLDFRLDKFVLSDATLIYRDGIAGTERRFESMNLQGSAASLTGPFVVEGTLEAAGLPLTFDARIGQLAAGRATALRLAVRTSKGAAHLELDGTLSKFSQDGTLTGRLTGGAGNLAALLQPEADGAAAGLLAKPLSLEGRIEATLGQAAINGLDVLFGDTRATGAVSTPLAGGLAPDITLSLNRVDLDRLLAGPDTAGDRGLAPILGHLAFPPGMRGSLNLSIDGVALNGGILRQVQLAAELADGRLNISRASALMPGGSDVDLSGIVAMANGLPRFEGRVELASVNLRGLLRWLKTDVSAVPAGRLGNLALTAQVRATPRLVEIFDGNLRLDATTITGGLAFFVQRRPSFSAALRVDRLNLDGYLPDGTAAAGPAGSGAPLAPLALLNDFDTRLKLQFDRLIYDRTPIHDAAVELDLIGGVLSVHRLSIADLAGARFSLTGSARDFAKDPVFDAGLELDADSLGGLARFAELPLPVPPSQLGGMTLHANARGKASRFELAGDGTIAGTRLSLKGTIANIADKPEATVKLLMDHQSLAALSGALGLGIAPAADADGPVSLAASIEGDAAALALDLKLDLVGASAQVSGQLLNLDTAPEMRLTIGAGADSLAGLMRSLGIDAPQLADAGEFGFSSQLSGNAAALQANELSIRLGPTAATGSATLALDRPRPHLQASLAADELHPEIFLSFVPRSSAVRWSRQPLDWSVLESLDADLDLSAHSLVLPDAPLVEPKLMVHLRDGVLHIAELAGKLFDGTLGLEAEFSGKPLPAVRLSYTLDDAAMQPALLALFDLDQVTGRMTIEGRAQTRGASDWDLVNGLQGEGRIALRDAVVHGIDIGRISAGLDGIEDATGLADLVEAAFSGGETRFASGGGTWLIRDGIATTDDMRATAEAGEATLTGQANLPAWVMDLDSSFKLTEHPDAPPLALRFNGPLDDPERQLDADALQRYLAGQAIREEGLRQPLEGKETPAQPQRPENAQEALKNALQDLLTSQ